MFTNIGGKIKVLAMILCWVGIIGSVIFALRMFSLASELSGRYYNSAKNQLVTSGLLILFIGPLFSWVSSFTLYGFGELIENTRTIINNQNPGRPVAVPRVNYQPVAPVAADAAEHKWRCERCGNLISTMPCNFCGFTKPAEPSFNVSTTCHSCGNIQSADNKFCHFCGASLTSDN